MTPVLTSGTPARAPLHPRTLAGHADRVVVPTYDRTALRPGVVHVGVGSFHRAHQAVYFDDLAEQGITDWGIVGVSLRRPDMSEALAPQNGLYTVVERGEGDDRARVVGALLGLHFAPDEGEAVHAALTDPGVRLVTLTITGGGYEVDAGDPGAFGPVVAALAARRAAGTAPFTVLSCDNVPANGATARTATLAVAAARDEELAAWIDREVAFPSSVVDRITPETTEEAREALAADFGVTDRWPVVTEPFAQWIVEDRFCGERPPLDAVGVRFVDDVGPYELVKKRLLNGGHSALGYVGYLLGHRTTDAAMQDPLVRAYVDALLGDEVAPLLPVPPGVDLDAYRATLLERFANPKLGDQLARLCGRGSTKVPAYLLPSIVEARRAGRRHELLTLAVAAWVRYLRGTDLEGEDIAIRDARLEELQPLAVAGGDDPATLLAEASVFGWLGEDPMLVGSVARALDALERDGLRETVRRYVAAEQEVAA